MRLQSPRGAIVNQRAGPDSAAPVEPMTLIYVFIFGSVAVAGATAAFGLVWALKHGQMQRFSRGATSIFDDEEPVGRVTDGFPDSREGSGR